MSDIHPPSVQTCPVEAGFDPFDPAYLADPYPIYDALRAKEPVFYAPQLNMWVVTRHADIETVFLDPATFSATSVHLPVTSFSPEAQQVLANGDFRLPPVMSNVDPPTHTRIRKHNTKTFSARRLAALEPSIRRKTEELIDAFAKDGRVDLMPEFSFPLPAYTIFTLIGFPAEDRDQLKAWCANRMAMTWGRPKPEEQVAIAHNMVAFWHYCQDFVQRRVHERTDDFTSGLLNIHDVNPEEISQKEVASIIYSFSFAGHETTTNLITNIVRQFLLRPADWKVICTDPSLIPNAVEEVLRFDTSVVAWQRVTKREVEIGGTPIPSGARVLLLLASGGRDATTFEDADMFDIRRENAKAHIAFGKGIHYCIGAPLGRMQARIALELLSARFPSLHLASDQTLTFPPNISFRGPSHFFVEWDV